jgi:glutaredoxin-related protein
MLKVYGSKNCPDCRNLKLNFIKYGIEFEKIEILDSLKNLKEFLHYRDNNKEVFER